MGRFRQHPAVRSDLRDAARWYEEHAGLGVDVFDKFDRAIDAIVERPRTWPRWAAAPSDLAIHRYFIKPYPYYVPYLIDADEGLFVMAFAHERRPPSYWMKRVPRGKSPKR